MKAEMLLGQFERVAAEQQAIPKLRELVLGLAVRGKLSHQNATESRDDSGVPFKESLEGSPFEIPTSWRWLPLHRFGHLKGGGTPSKARSDFWDGDIPWVSPKDMKSPYISETKLSISTEAVSESAVSLIAPGSLLFVVRGMILGHSFPVAINRRAVTINQDMKALELHKPELAEYLLRALNGIAPLILQRVQRSSHGTGRLDGDAYRTIPIPLAPGAEQRRIVAKVDELMALCDELEAAQQERERRRDRVVLSSLKRLTHSSTDESSFQQHARFHLDHLPRLTTRVEHVRQLRETILDLAAQGRLLPQRADEEPVSALLERNDEARKLTAAIDRRAESKPQSLFLSPDERWPIPHSWKWRGLADVVLFVDYRGQTPTKVPSGVRLVTAKNIRKGFISREPQEFVSEQTFSEWMTRGLPRRGDVLFTTEAPMGNAAVVDFDERFALAQRVINLRGYGALEPGFLTLQLLARPFQSVLELASTGLTAKGIKAAKLKRLPIAVPPLGEQRRIVRKVEEMMTLCDQLENAITTSQAARAKLLEALLHEALAG